MPPILNTINRGNTMRLELQYRHRNDCDFVILVDTITGIVRSDWPVTREVLEDFCDCSELAEEWDDREGDEHHSSQYGNLIAIRQGYTLVTSVPEKWASRVEFFV